MHITAALLAVLTLWAKMATPAKPICEHREPCRVGFLGLAFCSCQNGENCPRTPETTLHYENISYNFCEPPALRTCVEGQVAWVRRGLRQTIHCECPTPWRLTSQLWDTKTDTTQYKCSKLSFQQRSCEKAEDVCMVRNRVIFGTKAISLLKGLCECPDNQQCVETGQTVKSRKLDFEQDTFKCVPEAALEDEDYSDEHFDVGVEKRN